MAELAITLSKRRIQRRLTGQDINEFQALLRAEAIIVSLTAKVSGVATHPEDDLIFATAASAQADYLVTGDSKLQALGDFQRVTILSPRAFLSVLDTL